MIKINKFNSTITYIVMYIGYNEKRTMIGVNHGTQDVKLDVLAIAP